MGSLCSRRGLCADRPGRKQLIFPFRPLHQEQHSEVFPECCFFALKSRFYLYHFSEMKSGRLCIFAKCDTLLLLRSFGRGRVCPDL